MSKKVKQADIAKKLNVSIVTVSKALAGKEGVGKELRRKIIELAEEMGYNPSEAGIERAEDREFSISIIVQEQYMTKYGSFYAQINHQVSSNILNAGSYAYTEVVTEKMEENLQLPRLIEDGRIHGIIALGNFKKDYLPYLMERTNLPIVMLDFYEAEYKTDYIISDSYYGAYAMTRHLINKGHQKIAYVGSIKSTGSIIDRYHGYLKALSQFGLEAKEDYLLEDRYEESGRLYAPEEFVLPKEMPTAFFCNCDITAGRLIKRLEADGYRIPEDVSVAGFDNYIYPGSCDVALTTYEVDTVQMSKTAAATILRKLNNRSLPPGIHIIEGHLIERDSVKDISQK